MSLWLCGCSCANRGAVDAGVSPTSTDSDSGMTAEPTAALTAEPTAGPSAALTAVPEPTTDPTIAPTDAITADPTAAPTTEPTAVPTSEPTTAPVVTPTDAPAVTPTAAPAATPTAAPSLAPTAVPTATTAPTPTQPPKTGSNGLACPSQNGALQVIGTQLSDESGNAVQLRGVSTHGLAWFPNYVNQSLFTEMRESWNVNIVRLAMYTDEYGGYCSGGDKEKLKKLVKDGVKYATEADMYVIVDWHVLNDRDPNKYISDAKSFFKEMSAEFAGHNNVIYEICNEPNGGTSWQDIKKYAEEVIPVIRANDKNSVIIVGTPNWSQFVDKAAADPVTGEKNIMYALHFYAATHKDDLRRKLKNAGNDGLPVFVTEYGICDASGSGSIDESSANTWVALMDSLGVSYVCWNLSNKNETSALISSSCSKTSGFTLNDMSGEGKWLLNLLGSEPGPIVKDDNGDTGKTGLGTQGILPASGKTGDISWECAVSNSWESEGRTFCQYDITIKNNGKAAVDSWKITIEASSAPSVSNIWCAKAEVSGKTITVTNESFNGTINAGESVTGIGMIVSD